MKDLKELLGAKKKIDPIEKDAKLSAIKNMRKMAGDMMADDMQNMKKVTVAAPDEESLKKGLEKAKEVVGSLPEHEMSETPEDEMTEAPQEEMDEVVEACETPEDIDKLIAKLNEKKLELAKG
jgi:hypothetical protein